VSFQGPDADIAAIRALIDDYNDAVFRRDAHDWGACWADDGQWTLMGQTMVGREAIVALWETAMAGFDFVAFFAQPGSTIIDGDRATGRVYTHEVLQNPDGSISRPVGRYDDDYIQVAGRWLFASRRYTMLHGG
jgi:uncharacterized protein (TIGR02246 family)